MKTSKEADNMLTGTLYSLGDPQLAEIISNAGFDWVLIDMEHSTMSLSDVQAALQAMGDRLLKVVRVPGIDEIWIKRVLDTGCDGILVPMVRTAEEAARVIAASKYPVEGQRSVGVTRAHRYGPGFKEYIYSANREIITMIQIEHIEGVNNIDSILKINGIDSVLIGPFDLSASMGFLGQPDHPEVKQVIAKVKDKCRVAGVPYGIFGGSPEALEGERRDGCRYLLCGIDVILISDMFGNLASKLHSVN